MIIRKLTINCIEEFVELCQLIDEESQNMYYESGERKLFLEGQKIQIDKLIHDYLSCIWVAIEDNKMIGYLIAIGNSLVRIRHLSSMVIGVLESYSNIGVGTALLSTLFKWAGEKEIYRIELTVRIKNERAICFYKKFGFDVEGIRKNSLYINSHYEDELYMSKIFL